MLLGQFDLHRLGTLDRLQGSGQVLWHHLQTDLIVLRGHALHLVLVEEVGLQGGRKDKPRVAGFSFIPSEEIQGAHDDPSKEKISEAQKSKALLLLR